MATATAPTISVVDEEFLSPAEVAAKFHGLTTNTLAIWRSYKRGPTFVKIGRRVCYPLGSLQEWYEQNLTVCNPQTHALGARR